MPRWSQAVKADIDTPKVDAFLAEIGEVCKRHGFFIGHEDCQGAFIISALHEDEDPLDWLGYAHIDGTIKPENT
jgi:hypothetical protein